MVAEAISCVENGTDAVIFIPNADCDDIEDHMCKRNVKSLLAIKLEQHFKDLQKKHQWKNQIKVHSISRNCRAILFDKLKELIISEQYKNSAIFIDEVPIFNYMCIKSIKEISKLCEGRKFWLAISGITGQVKGPLNDVTLEKVKKIFAEDFYQPELLKPLRNSAGILEAAYPSIKGM